MLIYDLPRFGRREGEGVNAKGLIYEFRGMPRNSDASAMHQLRSTRGSGIPRAHLRPVLRQTSESQTERPRKDLPKATRPT